MKCLESEDGVGKFPQKVGKYLLIDTCLIPQVLNMQYRCEDIRQAMYTYV